MRALEHNKEQFEYVSKTIIVICLLAKNFKFRRI